jgi:UDP-glucose 4-epimerase
MENRKIAILGSNSFLARNLYKYLILKSNFSPHHIYLYDKDEYSIDGSTNYTKIDFSDMDSIMRIDFDIDVLFLYIGKTGTVSGFDDYRKFININEVILLNILTIYCKKKSMAKIVYPSTRLIYRGDIEIKVNEDAEKEFKSVYAITKFASESYLKLYSDMFGLKYCILRICTPYGTLLTDDGNYGTFEFFTNQAKSGKNITIYGDGSITKTYTHIEDICYIMLKCGFSDVCTNNIYNVGGDNKSLQEIGRLIADKYNVKVDNVEWPELDKKIDAGSTILDSSRLDDIIHYTYRKISD